MVCEVWEEAHQVIQVLLQRGYQKAVTTPHVMQDSYRNTTEGIQAQTELVQQHLQKEKIEFQLESAAEYYLDEALMKMLQNETPLLTFGNRYLLFETNYLTEPYVLKDFLFQASTKGYRPVLAHPERYHYMTLSKLEDLNDRGVLLQINLLSLSGYYSTPVKRMAERMIENKWVHFLGSDCHNLEQAQQLKAAIGTHSFKKAIGLPLLNFSL